ncbi:MAG TPA: replication initiator protein A [Bryobacteraceae bacterium]|jgi:hypothetical protein
MLLLKQMEETQNQEIKDVIVDRLITRVETGAGDETDVFDDPKMSDRADDRGGVGDSFEAGIAPVFQNANLRGLAASSETSPMRFAKVEKSLASLGFFTPSSRRVKDHKIKRVGFTREVDGKRVEVSAEIIPSAIFGLPVTADQDKYLALQQIITDKLQAEGSITNPIRFKSAELIRLLNRSTDAGKNYKEISEWLDVMTSTTIFSNGVVYKAGEKRHVKDRFRVFDRAVSVGKEMEDGTVADANYVWLSSWQLENINQKFLLPIDLDTYRQLKNHIAKALIPLLQIWLFASHKAGSFEKRYDELCEILALQVQKHPSLIVRQFRPSLDELTALGYLEKWRVEKTSDRKAYKILFFHGPKFHRDRRKRVEQKTQATELIAESSPVEQVLPEHGRLRPEPETQSPIVSADPTPEPLVSAAPAGEGDEIESKFVDELSIRGVMPSAAMKLLRSLPEERMKAVHDYIDYWDSIRKTKAVGEGFCSNSSRRGVLCPRTSRRATSAKPAKNPRIMAGE